jgi:hypothetical protein
VNGLGGARVHQTRFHPPAQPGAPVVGHLLEISRGGAAGKVETKE